MNTLSMGKAVKELALSLIRGIHTAMPGEIVRYDSEARKANVKPLLKRTDTNGNMVEFPVITDVPVVMPGTKKASIYLPVEKGDAVLLVFSERSLDQWLYSGNASDTLKGRRFDLTDAIAVTGLFPFTEKGGSEKGRIELKPDGQVNINNGNLTIDAGHLL